MVPTKEQTEEEEDDDNYDDMEDVQTLAMDPKQNQAPRRTKKTGRKTPYSRAPDKPRWVQVTKSQTAPDANGFKGSLSDKEKALTRAMSKTYSSIHQIERLKEYNPWTKKAMDMMDSIRITGGPITGERLNQLHEIANTCARETNRVVLEELNERLSKMRDKIKNDQQNYNQSEVKKAIEVAKTRSIQKYGKKINWAQLKESVYLVTKNLKAPLDDSFNRELHENFKELPTIQRSKKPADKTRHKEPYKNSKDEISELRKELAIMTVLFKGITEKMSADEETMDQGNS
ncbi:DgyrCDS14471 [Dimorphilus gyrociliatus]|uniref:DgyrCDS14471 n=2 Tax=Dimorphilus gyrociliatus TaxID=2664684 RepID=A0A7I8WDP2_9ANNE|nr:DgyrCDS14471 [Dimorphilus gyrociliatus]